MAAAVAPGEAVLEVGGGLGVLTRELARRGARVRVVELEGALAARLKAERLPGVEVVEGDALRVPLGNPDKVVANIPYSVASELIERLAGCGASLIVLMVQAELAGRLAARPRSKDWARLPALVQRNYTVEIVETVPPSAFFPQPRVRSCVVRMKRRAASPLVTDREYAAVVGGLFAARRKKIRNTVARAASALGSPPEGAAGIAEELGVADLRPEDLDVAQFEALAGALARLRMTK